MQTIFDCGIATRKFAMGSDDAWGQQAEQETIDLDTDAPTPMKEDPLAPKDDDKKGGKRKRVLNDEDAALMTGMTDTIWRLNHVVSEGNAIMQKLLQGSMRQ